MVAYLWLRAQLVKGRFRSRRVARMVVVGLISLVVVLLLLNVAADVDAMSATALGALVLTTLGATAAFGPHSSRFPVTGADVTWLYRAPLKARQLVIGELVWVLTRRLAITAMGGVALAFGRSSPAQAARVTGLVAGLVVLVTFLTVGAIVTRGWPWRQRTSIAVGIVLLGVALLQALESIAEPDLPRPIRDGVAVATDLSAAVGSALRGSPQVEGAVVLAGLAGLGLLACATAGQRWRRAARADAVFWADTDLDAVVGNQKLFETSSMRAFPALQGPLALAWFELAVLRRRRYQLVSSASFLVLAAVLTTVSSQLALPVILLVFLSYTMGSAFSGLAQHLRARTLHMPDGSLRHRVATCEVVQLLPLGTDTLATIGGITLADPSLPGELLGEIPVWLAFLAAFPGIRILGVALGWHPGRGLSVTGTMRRALLLSLPVQVAIITVDVLVSSLAATLLGIVIGAGTAATGIHLLQRRGAKPRKWPAPSASESSYGTPRLDAAARRSGPV